MTLKSDLPKLITFDGEARSGKGTIVQAVKDALRDEAGYKVMLIDAGQVFRCLVVAATKAGVNLDSPTEIDTFLSDDDAAERSVQFVKDVYHMSKEERDSLLYTNTVSENSAKIGARPLSQAFKDELLKKWLRDAHTEGYQIVLLDGRALEEVGGMLERENLCTFVANLFFTCNPAVGARRTLGYATTTYEALNEQARTDVDELVAQIESRNNADRTRAVQPIVEPKDAIAITLPDIPEFEKNAQRYTAIIDTSADISKKDMCEPVIALLARVLAENKQI